MPRERWAEEVPVTTSTKALHNIRRDSGPGGQEGVLVPPLVQCLDVPRERWAGEVPGVTVTEALHSIRTVVLAERKASWCLLSLWVSLEVFISFFRRHSMTCRCLDGHRTFPRHLTSNVWTCQGKGGQRRCQASQSQRRFTASGQWSWRKGRRLGASSRSMSGRAKGKVGRGGVRRQSQRRFTTSGKTVVLAERKASWCLLSLWVSLEVFISYFRRHSMTCRCLDGHRTFPRHLTSNAWTCQGKGGQRRCQSLRPRRRFTTSGETVVLAEVVFVPPLVQCLDVTRERWAEEVSVATSTKALHNIRKDSGPGGKEGVLVPPLVQCLDVPRERWAGEVPGVTVTEALHSIRTVVLAERKASWCLLSLWVSLEVFISFFRRHSMTFRCLDGHRTFPRHLTSNVWTCQGKGGQGRCQASQSQRRFTTSGETVVLAERKASWCLLSLWVSLEVFISFFRRHSRTCRCLDGHRTFPRHLASNLDVPRERLGGQRRCQAYLHGDIQNDRC
ncbi:uncharacterized protein LOC118410325 [Branchiostoma floridae]|uniref:Uncharacterized protein LOC118410325 n=1 Tax=Branchiostoma floridae TaxID=7739 RepID=A0A9J7KPN3_BRAFL|nr:uncharacterized protein LOC118410325 [Branchiostoma floridae]